MEQAQRLAHVLLQATRQIAEAMPRLRTFDDISHYTVEINRLENDGDRISREAIASLFDKRHRPDGRHPLEGHLRAPRGGDRRLRARRQHARGHRHQELVSSDVILVIVVATALAFDFTNGFHDTANAVATSISTRAMSPRSAVALAAILNFVGAFISLEVAATVAQGIVEADAVTDHRRLRRPDRRDRLEPRHLVLRAAVELVARAHRRRRGRRVRGQRPDAIQGDGLVEKVLVPALVAPDPRLHRGRDRDPHRLPHRRPAAARARQPRLPARPARLGLDALARPRDERRAEDDGHHHARAGRPRQPPGDNFDVPSWVVVSSATAIALGTYSGGWRIIRTMGSRIIKMDPAQGFSAQGAGAAVILAASHLGYPLSTTHVISGGVMGAGAATRLSAVRWGVAGNIAHRLGADAARGRAHRRARLRLSRVFGAGALGPVVVSLSILGSCSPSSGAASRAARRSRPTHDARRDRLGPAFELVWAGALAGVGVSVAFATLVLGATRAADHRRADRARVASA